MLAFLCTGQDSCDLRHYYDEVAHQCQQCPPGVLVCSDSATELIYDVLTDLDTG